MNLSWTKSNRLCKNKYWNKFRCSCIQLEHVITCSWNDCEKFRILRNLSLIKTKKSVLRLHCNMKTFAWHPPSQLLLLLFACDYCHPPDSLPTNVILIELSFWNVHVEYWEIKQNNDILQFLQVKAERLSEKTNFLSFLPMVNYV